MSWFSYLHPLEITKIDSPINGELKVVENFGKRILYANDKEQSGGTITGMWGKAIRKMQQCHNVTIRQSLMLGLGGGTAINILRESYPKVEMTAVEIDPVMIKIAEEYFGIKNDSCLKIINADAFNWLKRQNGNRKYDFILFDLYLGMFNPAKARTLAFLKRLKSLLEPKGAILYNAHYQNDEAQYQKLLKECIRIFPRAELILSYPYSRILFLSF